MRTTRFVLMLSEEEGREIQDFRFHHRLGSKAEAARQLIAAGLEKAKGPAATAIALDQEPTNPQ